MTTKTLILSLSLLAGAAAPALARERAREGRRERPRPVQVERDGRAGRGLERLEATEKAALARHDARLDEQERRRLELFLARHDITGRRAAIERARLADKQRVRHAENLAHLERKQRARAAREGYARR
jgi:hypothetical protein